MFDCICKSSRLLLVLKGEAWLGPVTHVIKSTAVKSAYLFFQRYLTKFKSVTQIPQSMFNIYSERLLWYNKWWTYKCYIKLLKSSLALFIPVQFTSWIISRIMRTQWAMGELITPSLCKITILLTQPPLLIWVIYSCMVHIIV